MAKRTIKQQPVFIGTDLWERWKTVDIRFMIFLLGECLRGTLRVWDEFSLPVTEADVEEITQESDRIRLLADAGLQQEGEFARWLAETVSELKSWRYSREDIESLENRFPYLFVPEVQEQRIAGKPVKLTLSSEDPVIKAGLEFMSRTENEDATLEDVAYSDEVNSCFEPGKMPVIGTLKKRLQGKLPVKKGRRKNN